MTECALCLFIEGGSYMPDPHDDRFILVYSFGVPHRTTRQHLHGAPLTDRVRLVDPIRTNR